MSPGTTTNVSIAGAVVDMATRGCGDDVDDSATCSSDMTKRMESGVPSQQPHLASAAKAQAHPHSGIVEG
jgi:hypothetical protein